MQSRSSTTPPFRHTAKPHVAAPGEPQPAERNEFADALSRMFEHRQRVAPDFAPPLRDDTRPRDDIPLRDDAEDWDGPRASLWGSLIGASALRRALSIVPLAATGYAIAWFLYFEPSHDVTTTPVAELKPETIQAAAPSEPPPPARPQVAESKSAPQAAAAPPLAAASPPAPAVAAPPSQPLSKDEIKELQGKLGAAGFAAGPIDGVVGPQTEAALRRYAQSRNLAAPQATQETLLRLRSETRDSQ